MLVRVLVQIRAVISATFAVRMPVTMLERRRGLVLMLVTVVAGLI